MPKRVVNPIKEVVKSIRAVSEPIIKNLSAGHKRGLKTAREMLGLFVCRQCGYHQAESFGVCPKCGRPKPGLYTPRKK